MGSCIGYGLLRDFILFSSGQFDNTSSLPNRTAAPEAICAQFATRNGTCGRGKRADREIGRSSLSSRGKSPTGENLLKKWVYTPVRLRERANRSFRGGVSIAGNQTLI